MNNKDIKNKEKSILNGFIAGLGILLFFIGILSLFQNFNFALSQFRSLWYFIIPLAIGFGIQIGLYSSIKHNARINAETTTSCTLSGGSMIACCSHFLLNIIPIVGFSGATALLMAYQKEIFIFGIIANIAGIALLLNHKMKMKGGNC